MRTNCTIGGKIGMRAFLTWLVPAGVVALAVARVSVWVQPHFAPVVLFPLLVGAALGAILCGLLQVARMGDARLAVAGTVLVALLAAAAEHAFFYLDYRVAHARKARGAGIAEEDLSPAEFPEYMRAQAATTRMQVPLWIGNAAAMVVAATGVVIWYVRFHQVGESLSSSLRLRAEGRSKTRLGEDSSAAADVPQTRPRDPNGTNCS
jgi:hypothetical protein